MDLNYIANRIDSAVAEYFYLRDFYSHHPELGSAEHVQPGRGVHFDNRQPNIAAISKVDSFARRPGYIANDRHHWATSACDFRGRFEAGLDLTPGDSPFATWRGKNLLLRVRVQARASRNEILGVDNDRLRIRTTATPTDGGANRKVAHLLADYLSVPPSRVTLVRGQKHRDKQFLVVGPVSVPPELGVIAEQPRKRTSE